MTVNYTYPELAMCYGKYLVNDYFADIRSNPFIGFNSWNYQAHNTDEIIRERAQIIFVVFASALSAYALITTIPVITAVVLSAALVNHSIQFFRVSETKNLFDFNHTEKKPSETKSDDSSTANGVSTRMREGFQFNEPFSDDDNY